jgi:hypothetical protein
MRRARLEGRNIGRQPLNIDLNALLRDRAAGQSLGQLARTHNISRATAVRILKASAVQKTPSGGPLSGSKSTTGSQRSNCSKTCAFRNYTQSLPTRLVHTHSLIQ